MLKNFTLGRYIPNDSALHKVDPRIKIIFCFLYSFLIFFMTSFKSFLCIFTFCIGLIFLSRVNFKIYLENLKLIFPILVFTCLPDLLFFSKDSNSIKLWFLTLSFKGLINCITVAFKFIFLVIMSSLVSFTTTPMDLTKALEWLIKPLKILKVPVEDAALIITLTLRFVPEVIEQTNKILDAQKIRGFDVYRKNILKKLKNLAYVAVVLLVSLIKRSDDIATAMECRCYTGKNRTKFRPLKFKKKDGVSVLIGSFVLFTALIFH